MAIIVDKVQKRRDIALSCKELFFTQGIKNLTISQIAKTAGVGKGTLYDYFKNKEDIVFEIVNIMIHERNILVEKRISQTTITKEKIKLFNTFFYSEEDMELRGLYKEFISISLSSPDEKMIEFQTQCFDGYYAWFEKIIEDGIENGELIPQARKLVKGIFVTSEGLFISDAATNSINNLQEELENYIDAIFELIEVKQC
ncbi:TetR/AcrR family transcriptional regulator [Sulfurimonas sp.]|uniref:TetR/AcrR family transcriptional regulator n=1 Tax=Sulfurimonas sp. TaxID=2022749 RepID=UPI002AB063D7|nr:TetR/AcrR family transcriptional regulator [Sulfurimonas sp.]